MEDETKLIFILDYLYDQEMLPMYFAELISDDNNQAKNCIEQHLQHLKDWFAVLPKTDIKEQEYWENKLNEGIKILEKCLN